MHGMDSDELYMVSAEDAQDAHFSDVDITDRYMFAYVMRNQEVCQELLQYIFPEHKIDRISYKEHTLPYTGDPQPEKTISTSFGKHGVRLDVYLNGGSEIYEVEMQTSSEKAIHKRAQFYSAQLTIEQIPQGAKYDLLKPSYVIFICKFDPFGEGLYRYSFEHLCRETPLRLNDGAHIVFLNTTGTKGEITDGMREILRYMNDAKRFPVERTELSLIKKIDRMVTEAKTDDDWRRSYMIFAVQQRASWLEGVAVGEAKGRAEGRTEGKILGAVETYRVMGLSDKQIKESIIQRFNLSAAEAARYMNPPPQQ